MLPEINGIFFLSQWELNPWLICYSESSGLDDEWEQEFDLEVTEDDIRMAEEAASKMVEEAGEEDGVRDGMYIA